MSVNIHMGLSENRVYSHWNSHLIGIMISKTIGFRGVPYFQTHPYFFLLLKRPSSFRIIFSSQVMGSTSPHHIPRLLVSVALLPLLWAGGVLPSLLDLLLWSLEQALGSVDFLPGLLWLCTGILWISLDIDVFCSGTTLWWTNILLWKDPPFFMGKSTINGHFPLLC